MNPKPFHVDVNDDACSLVGLFRLVRMKIQIHSLPLGAAFGAEKIAVSPVKLYTKQHCTHKRCFIRHDEIKMRPIGPITAD